MRQYFANGCLAVGGTAAGWMSWLLQFEAETRMAITLLGGIATLIAIVNGVRQWFRDKDE